MRAAARRKVEQERVDGKVRQLAERLHLDDVERAPLDVVAEALRTADAMRGVLEVLVRALTTHPDERDEQGRRAAALWGADHLGAGVPHVLTEMLHKWNAQAASIAKDAVTLDLEGRLVARETALAERTGDQLARVLAGVVDGLCQVMLRLVEERSEPGRAREVWAAEAAEVVRARVLAVTAGDSDAAN